MRAVELINKKRTGLRHEPGEIASLVDGYLRNDIPDYQMAAWLMAVCWRGLDAVETAELTRALVESGQQLSFRDLAMPVVDKHSTGGVGDKTTLVLVPMLAAAGCAVAKMSGRGLGHTGGTIDKLEAIPGVNTELGISDFATAVRTRGIAVSAQSPDLAPGDGRLYALRDVTGTVESIPLIASSVMSKKIATGARAVVLDVKVGSGAFMKTLEGARTLSRAMVDLGSAAGLAVVAVITSMDQPLGMAVGNILEVQEAVATLRGGGSSELLELCVILGAEVMVASGAASTVNEARARLEATISSGEAHRCLRDLVASLGGSPDAINHPETLPAAPWRTAVVAPQDGVVARIDALAIGEVAMRLGAGRATKGALIDPAVGVVLSVRAGDRVHAGQVLGVVHSREPLGSTVGLVSEVTAAFAWSATDIVREPLVLEVIR
ncbi:MAG: thymidine phosphorylase [Chloroflexi bacterium]|nr:thymidine phosphorylase [Chloroflexota bacterium]